MNKIGKGNFATVYKYERKSDNALFAVKSLEKKKIIESKRKRDDNPLLSEIDIMRA
jgi:serine/threonine protein kinase